MTYSPSTPSSPIVGEERQENKNYAVGHIKGDALAKRIHKRNILRVPEPSFTFDKRLVDSLKGKFSRVRVTIREDGSSWELSAQEFWELADVYNYGHGDGYRVACKLGQSVGQLRMPLVGE